MRREPGSALVGLALFALGPAVAPAADRSAAGHFFESKVRPLLAEHCTRCHGPDKQRGGLRLDVRRGLDRREDVRARRRIARVVGVPVG